MNGIEFLKQHDVKFGVSTVVHQGNIEYLKEIYDFFKHNYITFNIVPDFYPNLSNDYLEKFTVGISELFKYWYNDNECPRISFFNDLLKSVISNKNYNCNFCEDCCLANDILVVDVNGDLYPCSTLVSNFKYRFGNFENIISHNDIANTDAYKQILFEKSLILETCSKCDIKQICNGGCFVKSLNETHKDLYCKGWYKLIHTALTVLKDDGIME